ncbi:hypothetical protein psal_cds_1299 [Pandoravirus salinus]|uniref:Uncharacterized protein n=1 Tax=Pandoravirus salinus TaxID=1349410 RepID=S4W5M4_9VIRU|nr:hypothetical protein psal_cds_1299 [Pandoravirus salinus]AGO85670.1 hypothetical protein psal_cds_1299 [Pandoravirus salinus]
MKCCSCIIALLYFFPHFVKPPKCLPSSGRNKKMCKHDPCRQTALVGNATEQIWATGKRYVHIEKTNRDKKDLRSAHQDWCRSPTLQPVTVAKPAPMTEIKPANMAPICGRDVRK